MSATRTALSPSADGTMAAWLDTIAAAPAMLIALVGLAVTLLYAVLAVRRLKRPWEPAMGRSISRPAGLSAPTLRWLRTGKIDTASLTAAILALADKGALDVEMERDHVRLRKTAMPDQPLTRAEHMFADGLLRLASTILLNRNAAPMLQRAAAALQDGVEAEWRAYQAGRLKGLLIPAIVIAWAAVLGAALASSDPVWMALRAALAGCALIVALKIGGLILDSLRRLWSESAYHLGRAAFYTIALTATFGTLWMLLTFQGGHPDLAAALCGALTLAIPALVRQWAMRGRGGAGPLKGRIEALRQQLMSRAQGIDAIALSPVTTAPVTMAPVTTAPATAGRASNVTALVPTSDRPLTSWLADAIALDAMPAQTGLKVGRLALAFEDPGRLGAVLRLASPGPRRAAYDDTLSPALA